MARERVFIEANVLDEARKRINHTLDIFDNHVVSFSGGKDSLAVLMLVKEIAEERGELPINAVFRDEELIPLEVVDFVTQFVDLPWLNLEWWCTPLLSHKYVMGVNIDYVQWDPKREWMREKPPWAVTETDLGLNPGQVISQYDCDPLTIRNHKGSVAILTGIRAAESLQRYRAVVNKTGRENFIANSESTRRGFPVRPIFDWVENDVFRYFYDNNIAYCPLYDQQAWAGGNLRVSSALATSSARNFGIYRETSPEMYERAIGLFPEMLTQEHWFKEMDRNTEADKWATSWKTLEEWARTKIADPRQRATALHVIRDTRIQARRYPDQYPLKYVFRCLQQQGGKRDIMPLTARESAGWQ